MPSDSCLDAAHLPYPLRKEEDRTSWNDRARHSLQEATAKTHRSPSIGGQRKDFETPWNRGLPGAHHARCH